MFRCGEPTELFAAHETSLRFFFPLCDMLYHVGSNHHEFLNCVHNEMHIVSNNIQMQHSNDDFLLLRCSELLDTKQSGCTRVEKSSCLSYCVLCDCLSESSDLSNCKTDAVWVCFISLTILCKLSDKPRRLPISEILRSAHLAPTITPLSTSLRSHFPQCEHGLKLNPYLHDILQCTAAT